MRQPKPTQLQFYPSQWKDVLEASKWKFRIWMSTVKAFPNRRKDMDEAMDCLTSAIAEHQEEGGLLEPGIQYILFDAKSIMLT